MKVKKVWIAGVELIEFTCPECHDAAFAAKRGQDLVAECGCGFESTLVGNLDYSAAEIRVPRNPSRRHFSRRRIFARDGFRCLYCGWKPEDISTGKQLMSRPDGSTKWNWLSVHHVIPVAQGGATDSANLVTACWGCHRKIGTRFQPPDGWT